LKKSLLALSLGLAAAMAGTSVLANTGNINFEGRISSNTCPITIVNPEDGDTTGLVRMGSFDRSRFTAPGQEIGGRGFVLRIENPVACGITVTSKAKVTFNGTADPTGTYFSVGDRHEDAKKVVIVIKDKTNTSIKPGSASSDYDLIVDAPTDMRFDAYYRSTAALVEPGVASARVAFVVDIN
jgi:major type 1 subunit fimbrin (pilin)/fimbrial protein